MKRSAAILGPTPAFLSWTLVVPCPFRDEEARNPVDAAFRELRSLRAIAVGEIENRIVEGFCIHPDAATPKNEVTKGFPVDEVYAAFGGQEEVTDACRDCPANVPVSVKELESGMDHSKAGCFGWLPFGDNNRNDDDQGSTGFLRLLEVNDPAAGHSDHESIVGAFESVFESMKIESLFPVTTPAWFGVWSQRSFSDEQLNFLDSMCSHVDNNSIAWRRLVAAIKVASQKRAQFICSLMPSGNSDGTHWSIESQCSKCGITRTVSPCPGCRDDSPPLHSRRMKVVGLRPYLNLSSIVGEGGARQLGDRYRQRVVQETRDE